MQTARFPRNTGGTSAQVSDQSTLTYYFDAPREWNAIHKPLRVHFRGWAVSEEGPATVVVKRPDGVAEQHSMTVERPDVVNYFAGEGREVPLSCGFDFDVDVQPGSGPFTLELEVMDDNYSSGPVNFVANEFTSIRWGEPAANAAPKTERGNYKDTWNAVSGNEKQAMISVAGHADEAEFERTSQCTLEVLEQTVGIRESDVVLEIGCGVGRMAQTMSPICQRWIGCDVAENMLEHARQRNRNLPNVDFVSLNGWDLAPVEDASVDVVYCTVVFMHLDEWDRFNYVCESMRVLRPGGRLFVDNYNLLATEGWEFFMKNMLDHHPLDRPSNISKSSTPQELTQYLKMAGFVDVQFDASGGMWLQAWGVKPDLP